MSCFAAPPKQGLLPWPLDKPTARARPPLSCLQLSALCPTGRGPCKNCLPCAPAWPVCCDVWERAGVGFSNSHQRFVLKARLTKSGRGKMEDPFSVWECLWEESSDSSLPHQHGSWTPLPPFLVPSQSFPHQAPLLLGMIIILGMLLGMIIRAFPSSNNHTQLHTLLLPLVTPKCSKAVCHVPSLINLCR